MSTATGMEKSLKVVERERCVFQAGEIEVVQLNSPGLENGHQFELFFLGFILLCLISFMCTSRVHANVPVPCLCETSAVRFWCAS